MKILLTADWHIKLGQKNVPRDWAISRYNMFFEKIRLLEDDFDIHIISGDLFDRSPTLEELAVFFKFVSQCYIPTYILTGNHEAETRKKSFLEHLSYATNRMNGNVHIITEISSSADLGMDDDSFYLVPYEYIKKKSTWDELPAVPIFTHVRGEIPPHVQPEIPLEWLSKFPTVFAGDLHSFQNCQRNLVYPGSPMTTSFHRKLSKNTNGYIAIDTKDWSWDWEDFELPQLLRKTATSKEEMVPTQFHHTIYEFEGNLESIKEIKDSELLDKKIVKRSSEAALILNDSMTFEEELAEYFMFIMEVDNIEEVMTVYHEYDRNN